MPKKNARTRALRPSRSGDHRELLAELGKRVRSVRQGRKLTLRTLAQQSGLSTRFLSDLEAGRANLSVVSLAAVAEALGESPARLPERKPAQTTGRGVIPLLGLRGAGKTTRGKPPPATLRPPLSDPDTPTHPTTD